jgi:hypothetical protein
MSRESTESANVCWKKINVQAQYVCQSVCMYTHDVITCAECSVSCVLPSPQDLPAHFKVLSIIFPFGYAALAVFFKALYFLFKTSQAYATIMKANRILWSPSKHASEVSRERNDDIGTGTGRMLTFRPSVVTYSPQSFLRRGRSTGMSQRVHTEESIGLSEG